MSNIWLPGVFIIAGFGRYCSKMSYFFLHKSALINFRFMNTLRDGKGSWFDSFSRRVGEFE